MSRSRLKRSGTAMLLAVLSVSLAACGSNAGERVGGGAAGGAATGATFGLIGGPIGVLVGGAIGGGIGALTAANTTPKQIDLGNPLWARGGSAPAAPAQQPAGQSQQAGYGAPQPLTPAAGAPQGSYSGQGDSQGGAGTGIQSQPLPPPTSQ